jgi:nucleoside-diphosphate-sugar epimerase
MMKAFITGGTGFIGRRVIRKLLARGYEVAAIARSGASMSKLEAMGASVFRGNITEKESLRPGMTGSDLVFHLAGWYKLGRGDHRDVESAERINVQGTRNVLELASELGVPKTIYTSTLAVFGDTKGEFPDENFYQGGPFQTVYDRTKWIAHYEVAVPLIEHGAAIIILMPGVTHGPGDHSVLADLMRRFYRGQLIIFPGRKTGFTLSHVRDIAEAHILAAEKGRVGETYIIADQPITLEELVPLWAEITRKPPPLLYIPDELLRASAPLVGLLNSVMDLPESFSLEATRSAGITYFGRADKAKKELGWQPLPIEEGLQDTFQWIAQTTFDTGPFTTRERQVAGLSLFSAIILIFLWLLFRRKKDKS